MDGNALQALERDILAALELDEVLLAVDDGEQAVFGPLANVAREEPAVVVERLSRQVRALVCACVRAQQAKSESVPLRRPTGSRLQGGTAEGGREPQNAQYDLNTLGPRRHTSPCGLPFAPSPVPSARYPASTKSRSWTSTQGLGTPTTPVRASTGGRMQERLREG